MGWTKHLAHLKVKSFTLCFSEKQTNSPFPSPHLQSFPAWSEELASILFYFVLLVWPLSWKTQWLMPPFSFHYCSFVDGQTETQVSEGPCPRSPRRITEDQGTKPSCLKYQFIEAPYFSLAPNMAAYSNNNVASDAIMVGCCSKEKEDFLWLFSRG